MIYKSTSPTFAIDIIQVYVYYLRSHICGIILSDNIKKQLEKHHFFVVESVKFIIKSNNKIKLAVERSSNGIKAKTQTKK